MHRNSSEIHRWGSGREYRIARHIEEPTLELASNKDKHIELVVGQTKKVPFKITLSEDLNQDAFKPKFFIFSSNIQILMTRQDGYDLLMEALAPGDAVLRVFLNDESNLFNTVSGRAEDDDPIEIRVQIRELEYERSPF